PVLFPHHTAPTSAYTLSLHDALPIFHRGYLDSLPASNAFNAATCLLVSQFMLDREARSGFFREIAQRLKPGAILVSSDLASDVRDRKSTRLNSSHVKISYAVFCLKKK